MVFDSDATTAAKDLLNGLKGVLDFEGEEEGSGRVFEAVLGEVGSASSFSSPPTMFLKLSEAR